MAGIATESRAEFDKPVKLPVLPVRGPPDLRFLFPFAPAATMRPCHPDFS